MQAAEPTPEVSNHVSRSLQLLEEENSVELSDFLNDLHPVELGHLIGTIDPERQEQLIRHITGLDQLSAFIAFANEQLQSLALSLLDDSRVAAVVRRQEIDDAANIVGSLPRRRQVSVLRRLGSETVKEITTLLAYDQETAGRIMTTQYLSIAGNLNAEQAVVHLRKQLSEGEIGTDTDISYVYVTSESNILEGVCSLRELLAADDSAILATFVNTQVISVGPDEDQEKVANIIRDYDLHSVPVVTAETGSILGIVTVDDVLDVLEEEYTEDILKLAGTEDDDTVGATALTAVKSRLPWLLASWIGGTGGAMLLGTYSTTLERVVALAFFMPVVFGMGGNVGSQASTITVRGLATGDLGRYHIAHRLQKEAFVGILLGTTFGILLSLAAFLLYRDPNLSLTVGVSIMATMTCAASLGSMLPIIFDRLGFDPAVASGPFVTTSTDLLSIVIYFGVATAFL